jgi:hypothetical protein
LVADHLLLRDFEPFGIIFMNVFVVMTVAMVMLLRDFGFMGYYLPVCGYYFIFTILLTGNLVLGLCLLKKPGFVTR